MSALEALTKAFNDTDAGCSWTPDGHAAKALEALIEAGYAVMKLPTPDLERADQGITAFHGCNTIYYALDGRVESDRFEKWHHADDASMDALALLAAAEHIEGGE